MSVDGKSRLLRNLAMVAIPLLIIVVPVGYSIYTFVLARDAREAGPFLELPAAPHEGCVRETEFMRYHHWELLRQVRDEVVRGGVRGEISLDRCRECHPNRDRFCNRCHTAVSLQPDCFGCHYYPASPAADAAGESRAEEGVREAWTDGSS
ncbi:hypothetical protein KKA85_07055 [bacterium]|nr:hypothetical protein [bacterium]MBU1675524.1 hypothetical protein [bacterium]